MTHGVCWSSQPQSKQTRPRRTESRRPDIRDVRQRNCSNSRSLCLSALLERMTFESIGPVAMGIQQSDSWIKWRRFKPQGTDQTNSRRWRQSHRHLFNRNHPCRKWPTAQMATKHLFVTFGDWHARLLSTQQTTATRCGGRPNDYVLVTFSKTESTFRISHAFSGPKHRSWSIT